MIKRRKSLLKRMQESENFQRLLSIVLPLGLGSILLILWETQKLHHFLHTDTFTLPLPTRIIAIIGDNLGKILINVEATLIVAVVGLVLGSLLGFGIAVLATLFPRWGMGGLSIVAAFNAIPIVALAPVMTNWTKDISRDANVRSMVAKILVVMIVCMVAMSINGYRGLNELKPFAMDLMKSYAAKKSSIFFKLQFPNCIPYLFTALRVSVPASVIGALVSEYFAEYVIGVGRQIRENIVLAQYATAWAYIAVACLIGIILYSLLMLMEGIILKNRKHNF